MAQSADLQASEKQMLVARLKSSRDLYLATLADVKESVCAVSPGENCWSVLECAEHVSGAERGMFQMVLDRKSSTAEPDRRRDLAILKMADAGAARAEAPERSRPRGHFSTLEQARQSFVRGRERTVAFVEENREDLRSFTVTHPMGTFDAYQLLLIMALHAERHAKQIERIKSSTAYLAAAKQS